MQKALGILLTLTSLSVAQAQYDPAGQGSSSIQTSSQPAPIVQAYPDAGNGGAASGRPARGGQIFDTQPIAGVYVRSDVSNGVETVNASGATAEIRVVQGRANVTVHHPADHSQILVDLPGGQVSLLKDGLYTFNAGTNTVRVLHGEAEAYAGGKSDAKGTKVKETQELALLANTKFKSVDARPYELAADLLPAGGQGRGDGVASGYGPRAGYGPYGDGYYGGYPYYAGVYGYPWGGFYPYGYGYPFGVGLGFGYGGFGYRGGGFGYRGGFRR